MTRMKRITVEVPAELLAEALEATGKGVTETLVEGLERICRMRTYRRAMDLAGHLDLEIDLDLSRGRRTGR